MTRFSIELLLSSCLFLLFPPLSLYAFLFAPPAAALVQEHAYQRTLWFLLITAIIQGSVASIYTPASVYLPLILMLSVYAYITLICSRFSLHGITLSIGTVLAMNLGFLFHSLFIVERDPGFRYIVFITESLLISLSLYVGSSFVSWILGVGLKRIFQRKRA